MLCWAYGGESGPQNGVVLGFCLGKVIPKQRRFYKPACQKLPQHDALSSVSSKLNCNCLKLKPKLSIWQSFLSLSSRFPFANIPKKQSPLLSNTQTKANVTHSLAPIDTTAQRTKKPASKEKCEFTFPFSSVVFNFFWVDTMIGLSVDNVWLFWKIVQFCGQI